MGWIQPPESTSTSGQLLCRLGLEGTRSIVGSDRWIPSFGQFLGSAKVGPGTMIQAVPFRRAVIERRALAPLVEGIDAAVFPGPGLGAGGRLREIDALVLERAPEAIDRTRKIDRGIKGKILDVWGTRNFGIVDVMVDPTTDETKFRFRLYQQGRSQPQIRGPVLRCDRRQGKRECFLDGFRPKHSWSWI